MSSAPPPPPNDPPSNPEKQPEAPASDVTPDAAMDITPDQPAEETWEDIPEEIMALGTDEILTRIRLIENDIKVRLCTRGRERMCANKLFQVMRSETLRLQHEQTVMKEKIRDNGEKIKQNKVLPYLVGNVVEVRSTLFSGHVPLIYAARAA